MQALPYAIPAAAASFAYLNARHGISNDWNYLSGLFSGVISTSLSERRDEINFFHVFEEQAQARGDHLFIISGGNRWTYAQAYENILKYGTWLKSKGIEKNEIVAMDFMNSELFIWLWFGAWSIGAKPAFINYNLTGKPLMHTIKTSTARLVLVDENGRDKFSEAVMAEHGFVPRPPDTAVPRGRQAKYGFEIDSDLVPQSIKKHATAENPRTGNEPRRLEIIFFDAQLEHHILSLHPIRLPKSARSGETKPNMAVLIYTSGTTGLPKPAIVSWYKVNVAAKFMAMWLSLKPSDVFYTSMPLYHATAAVMGVCTSIRAGCSVCLGKKFSHKTFWPEVRASKATIIQYVGETLRYLLSAPETPLDKSHNVRAAFGNGCRPDVWTPFKERFNIKTIFEIYSATEAPGGLWNKSTNTFSAGAVGRTGTFATLLSAATNAVVRINPESDPPEPLRDQKTGLCQITDWNEPGELLYKLDPENISQNFQGYFGNDKATNSKVLRDVKKKGDAYFRSGDLLRRDKEGRWFFIDRLGDTFRWKAENVSTQEVSEVIGGHDSILEANVYGVLVPQHDGRAGCAAVVLKTLNNASPEDSPTLPHPQVLKSLADHLKKSLAAFAVPLFVRVTREMQTTGTNKQQKHHLQQDGIDVVKVEQSGDLLYWLKEGTYERFTPKDLEIIRNGGVKL